MTDTGGNETEQMSGSSPGQSSASSSPSPSQGSGGPSSQATIVSLAVIAILTYAWFRGLWPATTPWYGPPGGLVLAAIPGGALGGVLGQAARAAIDKIPGRGGK